MRKLGGISLSVFAMVVFLSSGCVHQADSKDVIQEREAAGIINSHAASSSDPLSRISVAVHIVWSGEEKIVTCSGVLIEPRVALTAASCVRDMIDGKFFTGPELEKNNDKDLPFFIVNADIPASVSKIVVPDGYKENRGKADEKRYVNDIAMLFLSSNPFIGDESELPLVLLDDKGIAKPGELVTVFGYGEES